MSASDLKVPHGGAKQPARAVREAVQVLQARCAIG